MSKIFIGAREIDVKDGEPLAEALIREGYPIARPCGGRGVCGKCLVHVDGKSVLACKYRVAGDIRVTLPEEKPIVSVTGAKETHAETMNGLPVLDIGTTTLAMALVSEEDGGIVRTVTRTNPQNVYGADVISRIGVCMKQGPNELHRLLIDAVNDMLRSLGVTGAPYLYAAGNTTMLHLFCNEDCSSLGKAPYTPVFLGRTEQKAAALGIMGVDKVVTLPGVAAFVGADITAGLGHLPFPHDGKHAMLIDLGTNAEIVLYDQERALCTAAAAGPCFEGANITCGMSASEGAICRVLGDDPLICETIGGKKACGICGTGLIDLIAALVANGTIDETGYLEDGRVTVAEDVFLTQADVRQYQLAKAAVCAGAETLLEMGNVPYEDLEAVYLAGGFAAMINIAGAVGSGLLPKPLASLCRSVGNTSLLGAVDYALGRFDAAALCRKMTYIDLSSSASFTKRFTDNMLFA